MSSNVGGPNKTNQRPRGTEKGMGPVFRRALGPSSMWLILLAVALILMAAAGLVWVTGLGGLLRPSPTATPTPSPTRTLLPSPTATYTASPTFTLLPPPTATVTPSPTLAPPSPTATVTPSLTFTPPSPTATITPSLTFAPPSPTATLVPSPTFTRLLPTATPTSLLAETTTTLQQGFDGYAGSEDTYIYRYRPDDNHCTQNFIKVSQRYAALLRFELTGIPADATVTQATLQLYAIGWSGADITIGAHYITRSVSICEATWNQAQVGNLWGQPGCDDTTTDRRATAESIVNTNSIGKWYDFNLTTVVQGWVNGSLANNGVLLRAPYSPHSFSFASSQSSDVAFRPKLVITYRTGGGPTPTPEALPTLIIGHISDAHIGAQWIYSQRLRTVLSLISQQAQVMLDTGDTTQNGTAEESADYVQLVTSNISIPWRAIPGNHDTPNAFETYIGPLEWSWDVGGYRLIGINTEAINYTALDQALTTEKPCIVLGHFPLSYCTPTDRIELRERFKRYNVPIYIAGHTHLDSLETDPESGTILLTGQRAGLGHYRLITLRGFEVESVSFENAWD